jgi:hypothetical protein
MSNPIPILTKEDLIRFWSYVEILDGDNCWLWLKTPNKDYGCFIINKVQYIASRISYFLHYKIDPNKLLVLHDCDNPKCVNPSHLFLGTDKDNFQDAINKNHHVNCTFKISPNRNLNDNEVRRLKYLYSLGWTYNQLAREFKINSGTVWSIINGVTYKGIN